MGYLRASIKLLLFSLICIPAIIIQPVILLFHRGKYAYALPLLWQKIVCAIFGIRVIVRGRPNAQTQTLFVSNHISYLDIPVIGSVIKASFIAKKDVKSWPVFGFLSTLQQTVFISRERTDASQGKRQLDDALRDRKSLIVFPEGTSTQGVDVLPFKSSLFSIALQDNAKGLTVQPMTLKIERVDRRIPTHQNDRDLYAWHINMDTALGAHLWRFAQIRGAEISLTFHEPINPFDFENRKTLAKHCQITVSNGLQLSQA